jgi:hypothetical protein
MHSIPDPSKTALVAIAHLHIRRYLDWFVMSGEFLFCGETPHSR